MGTYPGQSAGPEATQAALLKQVLDRLAMLESRTNSLPVLDADPTADEPGNLWGFDDGRLMHRTTDGLVHQFVPTDDPDSWPDVPSRTTSPATSTGIDIYRHASSDELRVRRPDGTWAQYAAVTPVTSADSPARVRKATTNRVRPAQTQPKTRTKTYPATWARSYRFGESDESGGRLHYGYYSGTNGERKVMYGFDDAGIRADLAGSAIVRVRLSLLNLDAYSFGGVRLFFGGHNDTTPPGQYHVVRRGVSSGHWPHSGRGKEWRPLATWFGKNLRSGDIRGVVIDQPSASRQYYGAADNNMRLEITYRR